MLDRFAIAAALREIGALLSMQRSSPFKVRAYERGARALEALSEDVGRVLEQGRLTMVPGIGPALARTIAELHRTGRSELLERLRQDLPKGVLELQQVPHLTLRRIAALQDSLGIASVDALRDACAAGRVRSVKGFGPKTEEKILAGIRDWEARGEETLLYEADREGEALLAFARSLPGVLGASLAGALRRRTETVDRLVLAIATEDPARVVDLFVRYPPAVAVVARTGNGGVLRLADGQRIEMEAAPPSCFAGLLHALTGSEAHRARLAALARERGFLLDREGLATLRPRRRVPTKTEEEIYRHLGLPYIPPEMREDAGEIEAAIAGALPTELVREEDIQGMVHCHTVYSDGKHTVEEMAQAADEMGMRYLTITDHSPTAHYARGLTLDRLQAQWEEIARVQETVRVRLLRGTESDILADGSLDYPEHVLQQMDVVIASIHSRHRMDADQMTHRLVGAMRNPIFKIWGHALGRYVMSRPPIECRMEEVLDAAAESRVAIEVNGDPHRLDMEPRWQREARKRGIPFVISTDAHSTGQLRNLRYGVAMARRGWLERREVLNTLGAEEFREAVRP